MSRMAGQALSDTERNYKEGNWGKGSYDAKALADMYGLDTSKEGRGEGHIWGRNADGSEVYIGKANMDLASNKSLIKSHASQANSEEADHSNLGESLSSLGDIKGAILNQWKGGGGGGKSEEVGITYSDKTAKAKAGEAAFESAILPYQGDYIMGKKADPTGDFMTDYRINLEQYKRPRDPNEIDGGVFIPKAEEAAVAGAANIGANSTGTSTKYEEADFDADRYYSG